MFNNESSSDPYPVAARQDNLLQQWDFVVPETYAGRSDLWELGDKLFEIVVQPLPRPRSTGSGDWRESLTVSGYEFFETWKAYLDVMTFHGEVIKSEFEYALNPTNVIGDPSWKDYGAVIVTKLPGTWNYPPMILDTTIFANGRVYSEVYNEDDLDYVLGLTA